ncbi:MAG: tRNA (adenosine(37)-N6)-threonylcarbamoyltransferase complex transferase subunit TsaD [Merdibacter sp.]
MKDIIVLGIESSCDETAVAIVKNRKEILSSVVATQIDVHKEFGGVIPEVASRIHVENISMVIDQALKKAGCTMEEIDAVAVTQGPGLIGCLHVGVHAAKTLAWAYHKPLVPVHHIAGHIFANTLITDLHFPLLALVVSGGHTELVYLKDENSFTVLGETQDDAIGEAFDKVARVMDCRIRAARRSISWPRKVIRSMRWQSRTENPMDFSFAAQEQRAAVHQPLRAENETFVPAIWLAASGNGAGGIAAACQYALDHVEGIRHFVAAGGVAVIQAAP